MNDELDAGEERPQRESRISMLRRFGLSWKRAWTSSRSRSSTGEEHRQHESSISTWRRFTSLWKQAWTSLHSRSNTGEECSQHESGTSPYVTLIDAIQPPNSYSQGQEKGEKEPGHEDQPQDGPCIPGPAEEEEERPGDQPQEGPSGSVTHTDGKEMVITSIRAIDVACGLGRLPAGFYAVVQHSRLEWRTENMPSSVNNDGVEWSGPIPIPLDQSTTICLEVYASFEFQPMLGNGEQLRKLETTVEYLLDRSAKHAPFTFSPKDEDVVSPCSSILVTIERQKCENGDSLASRVLSPHCSTTESQSDLEYATIQGQGALLRYRKHGEKLDLERSIEEFERALSICSMEHPCRAAAQVNLAMAKFIFCQVENADVPLSLCTNALAARPIGHPDRPRTLIQLAAMRFVRFTRGRDEVERAQAEALLCEAMELSSTNSHENRAASFMLQLHAGRRVDLVQADGELLVGQESVSHLEDEDLRILGSQLLDRFQRFGDSVALEQAIAILEKLARSTPVWDDRYCSRLVNLGVALSYRFEHLGEFTDLEAAISRYTEAVDLTPDGHPHKPTCLNNLGSSLNARFECLGELSDLGDAISMLRDAINLTSPGHPQKPGYLNNLGSSFKARFDRLGELNDLKDAISSHKNAVDLTPHEHPDRPRYLNNLGISFIARFRRLGELRDLEDAISSLNDAVDLTPHGHPQKPSCLTSLGNSLFTRFGRFGELSDLEDTISKYRDAIGLTPHGHPQKPTWLNNLGSALTARFERIGELCDLEDAILTLRDAVDLTPDGHPDKPARLHNLSGSLSARFERLGGLSDLEEAISILENVATIVPHRHPHRPGYLNILGGCFQARFERLGKLSDLEHANSNYKNAVDLTPDGHPEKPTYLSSLGSSFNTRFGRLGKLNDIDNAISRYRDATELTPHMHPQKPVRLHNLGHSFLTRFACLGELSDLEGAISNYRSAIELIPHGHPHRLTCLNSLGNSLKDRFERLGDLGDLENAILILRDAVDLTPNEHPDRRGCLSSLGSALKARFRRLGQLSDIENAIFMLKHAVELTPHGHPDRRTLLNNLGNSFKTRFERLGEPSDLEDAISALRGAADLTPHGHPDKPTCLNNLGSSFTARFERLGELSDLEDAISILRDAIDLTPGVHPVKPACLSNLGNSLNIRFRRLGELSDLEEAISRHRDAVELTPHKDHHKPGHLSNLGISFQARFVRLGELSDVEDAISALRDAVDLTPDGHPEKPGHLSNLGISFQARFDRLGEPSDVDHAISTLRNALDLTPDGHPEKLSQLSNLGSSFSARFDRFGRLNDLEQAISLYSGAASAPFGPISVRFYASQAWISCARRIRHHSLFHAYSVAITLLPQLAWIGLSLSHRYSELTRGVDVVREAAAAALDLGLPETAVEWLEQGRSIVWGELLQLRSSCEELSSAHPDHARRLRELSSALEHASATREQILSSLSEQTRNAVQDARESLQQQADGHRTLAIERDKLLQKIRSLPGFERFLLYKEFSQLRASAHSGPVVILNAAESRCDALIVLADVDHVIHVPLPNFTLKRSTALQNILKSFLRRAHVMRCDHREATKVVLDGVSWSSFLSPLWKCAVKPVLDALAFSTPCDLSRIFWCPTGPFVFLPVHAAGFYDAQYSQPGHKVYDFVISSYIPTLSILALPASPSVAPSGDLQLLAVRQPSSDGLSHLPGVHTELEHIKDVIRISPSAHTTLLESSVGTVEEVLSLMKASDWVHFACHGIQDGRNPTDSGLCLAHRRRLKLRDVIALSRPRGGLAFLSACQTATGHEDLTDEAIHIAAGMLFAGYGGVVGTMWSISDALAPGVARDVYEQLLGNGTRPDYRKAARALQEAVGRLRESGEVSFDEWIPFIHMGL